MASELNCEETNKKLAQLFVKLWTGTDCQTTFKLHEVVVMVRECFDYKDGSEFDKSEAIVEFSK